DHALVLHAAVLAAGALPVLFRAEDAFAEQAVLFGTVSAVVDGLGLLDLPEGPAANIVGAGQADAHSPVVVDPVITGFAGTPRVPSRKASQAPAGSKTHLRAWQFLTSPRASLRALGKRG